MDLTLFRKHLLKTQGVTRVTESTELEALMSKASKSDTVLTPTEFKKAKNELETIIKKNLPSDGEVSITQTARLHKKGLNVPGILRVGIKFPKKDDVHFEAVIYRQYDSGSKWRFIFNKFTKSGADMLVSIETKQLDQAIKKLVSSYQKHVQKQ